MECFEDVYREVKILFKILSYFGIFMFIGIYIVIILFVLVIKLCKIVGKLEIYLYFLKNLEYSVLNLGVVL